MRHAQYGGWLLPVHVRSYSKPSGLTAKMIQISRLFTMFVIWASVPVVVGEQVEQVERLLDRQVLAGVMEGVEQDLGLALVRATLSLIFAAQMSDPGSSCRC